MENYKLGKHRFKMPSSWQEISFNLGFKLITEELNEIQIFSQLSGLTEKEIKDSTDFENLYHFINAFTFLKELPGNLERPEMPKTCKLGGRLIIFPYVLYADTFDLGKCSVGQVKDMEQVITSMTKEFIGEEERELSNDEVIQIMPYVVSIYVQMLLDHEYDYAKAMKLVDEVKDKMSFKEVLNIGSFFLQRLIELNSGQAVRLRNRSLILRKLKRGWQRLIQRLASMLPSIR